MPNWFRQFEVPGIDSLYDLVNLSSYNSYSSVYKEKQENGFKKGFFKILSGFVLRVNVIIYR